MSADAIHQVVRDYYDAFASDPAEAATFYGEPTLVVLRGRVMVMDQRADIERRLSENLNNLRSRGYVGTRIDMPCIRRLTETCALYSNLAVRMNADGVELQRAGFTYLLVDSGAGWKIHQAVETDPDKLIQDG